MLLSKNETVFLWFGFIFIALSILLPYLTENWTISIIQGIRESIQTEDSGKLAIIVFSYIARGLVIYFLMYVGSMLLSMFFNKNKETMFSQLVFTIVVTASVIIFNIIHLNKYSLLTHFFMILVTILLMSYVPRQRYFILLYSIILMQIILSVQWLNLIPSISNLGFGMDDLSTSIKIADAYLTSNKLLNIISVTFFLLFLSMAIFFTLLIHNYTQQILTLKKIQQQERELKDARIQVVESRVMKEIHMLVHDLKSPLVTVEGLTSLLMMIMPGKEPVTKYLNKIDNSLNKMKEMISEILYEDERMTARVKELIEYAVSHTVFNDKDIDFVLDIADNLPKISINKIRMARVITNIIENAVLSIGDTEGYIGIKARAKQGGVVILIEDDGPGISPEKLNSVWEEGYSTKKSSGLGLPFAKRVVENHGGTISIESKPNSLTVVSIFIQNAEGGNQID